MTWACHNLISIILSICFFLKKNKATPKSWWELVKHLDSETTEAVNHLLTIHSDREGRMHSFIKIKSEELRKWEQENFSLFSRHWINSKTHIRHSHLSFPQLGFQQELINGKLSSHLLLPSSWRLSLLFPSFSVCWCLYFITIIIQMVSSEFSFSHSCSQHFSYMSTTISRK